MYSGRVSWGIKVRFFAFSSFSLVALIFLAGCGGGTSSGGGGTPPPQNPQLTIVLSGTGTVTSSPSGINCGTTCSASFGSNTQVTLTATAANGFAFTGWNGGGCTGTSTCAVTLSASTSVTATFSAVPSSVLTITMSGPGTGAVTSNPSGINCPTTCSASFANGTQLTLTATPGNTFSFGGWSGGCSGISTCVVTLNAATTVNAAFGGSLQGNINHIIFLAQENRSFDHYFGELRQYWKDNGYPDQSFDGLPQFNPTSGQPPLQGSTPTNPGCNLADPYSPPPAPFQDCVFDPTNQVPSFHLQTACVENPSPSWNESHVDWSYNDPTGINPATLDGFVWTTGHDSRAPNGMGTSSQFMDTNGVRVMGYYNGDDLNYYYFMASNFATSDRWFSPVMSRTNPNREYLIGATSYGLAYPNGANSRDNFQIPTSSPIIFQELQNAGISWKVYVHPSHVPPTGSCKPDDTTPQCLYSVSYLHNFAYGQTIIQQFPQNIVPISQFYIDAANGTLPQVAQIEPASASGLDEHAADFDPQPNQQACCSVQAGAAYVAALIDAVMGSPSAPSPSWKDSVFFLTYDEFGGFYDHVSPQPATIPDTFTSPVDLFLGPPTDTNGPDVCVNTSGPTCEFQYTGYRVPLIVVSPFARKNYVSHATADYTAILKLIEERFNLNPLSARDAAQIDMASPTDPNQTFFDFVNVPWATPPTPPKQRTNLPCDLTPPVP